MTLTGVFASAEDLQKLKELAARGWMNGDIMIVFSVGEGLAKEEATLDAKKVCHKLALDYGLPEIDGYYGIANDGEFVSV